MAKEFDMKVYCFGKNHKEFVVQTHLNQATGDPPNYYWGTWTCDDGMLVKSGNCETGNGSLYIYSPGGNDDKHLGLSIDSAFGKEGRANKQGVARLVAGWVKFTNQGEHKWTVNLEEAKKWREMYKVGLEEAKKQEEKEKKKQKQ